MANMARKLSAGDYQIGAWNVQRHGRAWLATAPGIVDTITLQFSTLATAHHQLTGEPIRARDMRSISARRESRMLARLVR